MKELFNGRVPIMIIVIFLLAALSSVVWAESLFDPGISSMYADYKARQVGDLVTVLIIENASATQSANTSSGKDNTLSIGPGGGVLADLIPLMRITYGDQYEGAGTTSRGGSITAKLTTKVIEIFNNGTMKIEGRQKIVINGEEQEIVISGIVRNRDIDQDNTILSSLVADAEIEFVGTGVVGDKQKPGILTRFFNWLF